MFSADYYRNLKMILLHLANPQGRGFIFASSLNQGLIPLINNALKEEMRSKNIPLSIVDLKEEELPLQTIQKAAAANPNHALIVNFLDILIVTEGVDILQSLNYGREILNHLNVPIFFWASESTRQLLANQAIDLYSQRRFADITFEDAPLSIERPSLETRFDTKFKTTEEYQNIKLRITLLETQLEEAKANHISDKSVCESLVPQLINAYVEYNMLDEAKKLIDTYEKCFEGTIVQLEALAYFHSYTQNFEKALKLYQKILSIEIDKGYENTIEGQKELVGSYSWLGATYRALNQPIKALEYGLIGLNISEKIYSPLDPDLATLYNDLAITHRVLFRFDKALEYNLKDLYIVEKNLPKAHPNIAVSYDNLAMTYYLIGNLSKAIDYMQKAVSIREKILPKTHWALQSSKKNLARFIEERQAKKKK
jgi:tetratricopeptide (TPR) repeat protein